MENMITNIKEVMESEKNNYQSEMRIILKIKQCRTKYSNKKELLVPWTKKKVLRKLRTWFTSKKKKITAIKNILW